MDITGYFIFPSYIQNNVGCTELDALLKAVRLKAKRKETFSETICKVYGRYILL